MSTLTLNQTDHVAKFKLSGLRYAGFILGAGVIALALATYMWNLNLAELFTWLENAFGPVFIVLFTALSATGIFAVTQLNRSAKPSVWYEIGLQASSGISTLALTFTLLGISLGIESLSQQALTPETVGNVIQDLTRHFSTAFMTTVVGLPASHIIRSILTIRWVAKQNNDVNS